MKRASPRQLEVFVAIADSGSVRAAAARLHLTQPAASMALGQLERDLGRELFTRQRGRLQINARGRELLAPAREVLGRLDEIRHLASGSADELRGELRLGASNTIGNYLAGELLGDFVQANPQVAVRLTVDNTRAIADAVRGQQLDAGCVEGPVLKPGIAMHAWRPDRLVVCVRPDDPLASRERLRPADFAGVRWIMRESGSATRALCERALAALPVGRTVLELGQTEAIKQAVIAGLGIACLPEVAIDDAVSAGHLLPLDTPFLDLHRRLSLLLPRTSYQGTLVDAFAASVLPQQTSAAG